MSTVNPSGSEALSYVGGVRSGSSTPGGSQYSMALGQAPTSEVVLPPPPRELTEPPTLGGILQGLRQRWKLGLVLGLGGALAAAALCWFLFPAKQLVSAKLHISSRTTDVLASGDEAAFESLRDTAAAIARGRTVIDAALKKPGVAELRVVREQSEPAAWVERELKTIVEAREIVKLTLPGERPDAKELMVALSQAAVEELADREKRDRKARLVTLETALKQHTDELIRKKEQRTQMGGSAFGSPIRDRMAQDRLDAANRELLRVQTELKNAEASLLALQQQPPEETVSDAAITDAVDERLRKDERTAAMLRDEVDLQRQMSYVARVATASGGQNSQVGLALRQVKQQLNQERLKARGVVAEDLRAKAASDSTKAIRGLRTKIAEFREQEKTHSEEVQRLLAGGGGQGPRPKLSPELEKLDLDILQLQESAMRVGNEVQGARVSEQGPARITLLEEARQAPRDDKKQIALAGLAGVGVLGAVGFGLGLLEFQARRVTSSDQVANSLRMRVLGTLPQTPPNVLRRINSEATAGDGYWQNLLHGSVDAVRTMMLHSSGAEHLQVLLVTSAVEAEGKTTLATHLAASLARSGRRTLLMDGDLHKPSIHELFEVPQGPGLCDVLRGETGIGNIARPTQIRNLEVMSAGQRDQAANQALAQMVSQTIFSQLRKEYDFILIDAGPLLAVTDVLLFAQHVDGVLFTVFRGVSRLPEIYAAQQRLAGLGMRPIGAVVHGENMNPYGYYPRRTKRA